MLSRIAGAARSPLRCATSADGMTHLVVTSPALRWADPDRLPPSVLCGLQAKSESAAHPAEVECGRCLSRAGFFMALPSFEVVPA